MHLPTQQRLKELFTYVNGQLIHKTPRHSRNTKQTAKPRVYAHKRVDGKLYKLHRLIFMYHHGYCPDIVDHINRDIHDNRIENLRPSNKRDNFINSNHYDKVGTNHKGRPAKRMKPKWLKRLRQKLSDSTDALLLSQLS